MKTRIRHRQNNKTTESEKTCLLTRQQYPREQMLRFVLMPDGKTLCFDFSEKLPGRGMWLFANKEVVTKAIEKRSFQKPAGRLVSVPENFIASIEERLYAHSLELMGLAKKSGALVQGYEAVKKALSAQQVACLITADTASERMLGNLTAHRRILVYSLWKETDLGQLSKEPAQVYLALLNNKIAGTVLKTIHKLKLFNEPLKEGK